MAGFVCNGMVFDGAEVDELAPAPRDREVYALIDALDRDIGAMALHVAVARAHDLARALRGTRSAGVVRDALRALWPLVPAWVEARWRWAAPEEVRRRAEAVAAARLNRRQVARVVQVPPAR